MCLILRKIKVSIIVISSTMSEYSEGDINVL